MPNRLAAETSPYLLQHANNPVDWYPWGNEALARAKQEDKPILLSIGYAACHWCHVMERESFEDEETAGLMNAWFVSIKVDREERPDIDSIYMSAVQAMTGHGGWPMTMFLTPDGKPFYGGTYYPREPRHGMPAFRQVLEGVHDAWVTKRDDVEQQAGGLIEYVERSSQPLAQPGQLEEGILTRAADRMVQTLDDEWGGFGGGMKFPQAANLEFLLRRAVSGDVPARDAVTLTLDKMARGGIFDQVGGGFHRYAVDRIWLVPHFEKMLYDNAQLLRLYTRAWQVTQSDLYRNTAIATGEYLLREMQQPQGGFSSSQDADSEGVEGKYYVWPYEEIIAIAGDDLPIAIAVFALSGNGNWEGVNVLWRPHPDEEVAAEIGVPVEQLRAAADRVRAHLLAERSKRIRPATDDKVLASWNGLAIAALAEAGRVLGREDFVEAAARAATFVVENLTDTDGRVLRSWREGKTSGPGFLDDYAMLGDGLLTLYETTFETRWWHEAKRLGREIMRLFADERGGFYDTGSDASQTVVRPKDLFDNAVPSGNSAAADLLLRLAALSGDRAFEAAATRFLELIAPALEQAPGGFGNALSALDRALGGSLEIAVVGPSETSRP
ncbi:MAG TPA: thioredoxin domain-containing protein, partial [Actinomycetota bacterium]|nr:thioredoxin domain-containing protein [Actinomycetota bacterium]